MQIKLQLPEIRWKGSSGYARLASQTLAGWPEEFSREKWEGRQCGLQDVKDKDHGDPTDAAFANKKAAGMQATACGARLSKKESRKLHAQTPHALAAQGVLARLTHPQWLTKLTMMIAQTALHFSSDSVVTLGVSCSRTSKHWREGSPQSCLWCISLKYASSCCSTRVCSIRHLTAAGHCRGCRGVAKHRAPSCCSMARGTCPVQG